MTPEKAVKLCAPFVMAACATLREAGLSHREVSRIIAQCIALERERVAAR